MKKSICLLLVLTLLLSGCGGSTISEKGTAVLEESTNAPEESSVVNEASNISQDTEYVLMTKEVIFDEDVVDVFASKKNENSTELFVSVKPTSMDNPQCGYKRLEMNMDGEIISRSTIPNMSGDYKAVTYAPNNEIFALKLLYEENKSYISLLRIKADGKRVELPTIYVGEKDFRGEDWHVLVNKKEEIFIIMSSKLLKLDNNGEVKKELGITDGYDITLYKENTLVVSSKWGLTAYNADTLEEIWRNTELTDFNSIDYNSELDEFIVNGYFNAYIVELDTFQKTKILDLNDYIMTGHRRSVKAIDNDVYHVFYYDSESFSKKFMTIYPVSIESYKEIESTKTVLEIDMFFKLPAIVRLAKEYEELNPDVKIEVKGHFESTDINTYIEDMNSKLTSNSGVDVLFDGFLPYEEYIKNDLLLDLDKFANDDDEFSLDLVPPNITEAYRVDGSLYQYPINYMIPSLVINKSIFEELEIDIPKSLDWHELLGIVNKVTDSRIEGRSSYFALPSMSKELLFDMVVAKNIKDCIVGKTVDVDLLNEYLNVFSQMGSDVHKNPEFAVLDGIFDDIASVSDTAISFKYIDNYRSIAAIKEYLSDDYELVPLPSFGSDKSTFIDGFMNISINKNSENVDLAKDFFKFVIKNESQLLLVDSGQLLVNEEASGIINAEAIGNHYPNSIEIIQEDVDKLLSLTDGRVLKRDFDNPLREFSFDYSDTTDIILLEKLIDYLKLSSNE